MEKAVSGHGVFIYDAPATIARYGSTALVAAALRECDMQHAWVRLHGASQPESHSPTLSLITALKQEGIGVAGWGWCQGEHVSVEVELALTTLSEFGLQDYIADALLKAIGEDRCKLWRDGHCEKFNDVSVPEGVLFFLFPNSNIADLTPDNALEKINVKALRMFEALKTAQ